jgi:hypothetical protein
VTLCTSIILIIVLYGNNRIKKTVVFENRVLKWIFRPKTEVIAAWRRWHEVEHNNLYCPTKHSNDKVTKSTGEWMKILIRKPERNRSLRRYRRRCKANNKFHLK